MRKTTRNLNLARISILPPSFKQCIAMVTVATKFWKRIRRDAADSDWKTHQGRAY
jgi:hypothetical protein